MADWSVEKGSDAVKNHFETFKCGERQGIREKPREGSSSALGRPNVSKKRHLYDNFKVNQLVEMGIKESFAKKALFCTGNQSIQLAVNWALDHNEESSNDSMELGQIQSTSTNGHLKVNDSGSSSFKKPDKSSTVVSPTETAAGFGSNGGQADPVNYLEPPLEIDVDKVTSDDDEDSSSNDSSTSNDLDDEGIKFTAVAVGGFGRPCFIQRPLHYDRRTVRLFPAVSATVTSGSLEMNNTGDGVVPTKPTSNHPSVFKNSILNPAKKTLPSTSYLKAPAAPINTVENSTSVSVFRGLSIESNCHNETSDEDEEDDDDDDDEDTDDESSNYSVAVVVNCSLKMGAGKVAKEVARAMMGLTRVIDSSCNSGHNTEIEMLFDHWRDLGENMQIVRGNSTIHLKDLKQFATDLRLSNCLIEGRESLTEYATVLSVFGSEEELDHIIGRLPPY